MKDGVVVGVSCNVDSRLKALQGQPVAEVECREGRPTYILPPGTQVVLRYSEPQRFTDSYEAYLVFLDGERVVRGTEHFVHLD